VASDEYYGQPRNMEPGTEPARMPRFAGQRSDELLPGQNSGDQSCDRAAIGTPGGGLAAGGLGGTNAPDGLPDDQLLSAMAWGTEDRAGDEQQVDEPQAGPSGGAVGGTPAGKRVRPK
jgi:hypothetical protein